MNGEDSGHNQLQDLSGQTPKETLLVTHVVCLMEPCSLFSAQEPKRVGFPCHLCLRSTMRGKGNRTILCWLLKLLRSDMCYFHLYSIGQKSLAMPDFKEVKKIHNNPRGSGKMMNQKNTETALLGGMIQNRI